MRLATPLLPEGVLRYVVTASFATFNGILKAFAQGPEHFTFPFLKSLAVFGSHVLYAEFAIVPPVS